MPGLESGERRELGFTFRWEERRFLHFYFFSRCCPEIN